MTPVEKLQAGIDLLNARRNASSAGLDYWRQYNPLSGVHYGADDAHGETVVRYSYAADAELDELLHRTIDAQLAILAAAHSSLVIAPGWADERAVQRALDLADAIVGAGS